MVDIRVTGLVKSFDLEKRILDGLSFQVDSGERVGLLGRNGAGKTTVFRMLTGELEPDEGEVQIAAGRRVGLISQIPVYPEGYTVEDVLQTAFARMFRMKDEMDALALRMEQGDSGADTLRRYGELNAKFEGLGGWDTETAVNKVANGLSIPREMRQREFACLSGGEKTRVNLGRLILEDTDILLLDEPTNHLDLQATEWLEGYLRRFRGTVLTISHDRYFLDRTVTRIIEVQDGKAEFYSGNYSFYAIEKERRYQERMKQYLKEQAKIAQLEKAAEQMHLWAFMGNDALHKRAFSMEKRIERMRTTAKPTKARKLEARFQSREFKGDEVLQIKGVSKAFGEKRLFEDVYLRCEGGERIALLGENGAGKSTLLDVIQGKIEPTRGRVKIGQTVRFGVLSQQLEELEPYMGDTIREVLGNYKKYYVIDGKETSPEKLCERLGFTTQQLWSRIGDLSGGQRRRLSLLLTILDEPNVLILDEPGNDLDTDMLAIVEDLLDGWPGTLILVTHDRFLMERVTDQQWALLDGHLTHMPGGVDQYLRLCNATAEGEPVGAPSAKTGTFDTGAAAAAAEKPKSSGQPNGLSNAERQKLRREVSSLERKMETQRARVEEAEAAMAQVDPTNYTALGEQQAKIDEAHAAMDELEMAWLEASEKLEGEE